MKYNIEEVDVYSLVKFVDGEFNSKMRRSGLKHEFIVYRGLPTIHTDKGKVYEVLTNMISNAIKYTQKGKITIRVERKGGFIQFSVEDTGIGIARKDYSKLFKRFSQIDSSVTREYRGSGLGLSICKEFITNLGGKIWFKSKVGKGSTFYFRVPIESRVPPSKTVGK
jgi:signal transduction histidine kinase